MVGSTDYGVGGGARSSVGKVECAMARHVSDRGIW
jgi:hypothetical protein